MRKVGKERMEGIYQLKLDPNLRVRERKKQKNKKPKEGKIIHKMLEKMEKT